MEKHACNTCKHFMVVNWELPIPSWESIFKCSTAPSKDWSIIDGEYNVYANCEDRNHDGHCELFEPKVAKKSWWKRIFKRNE